ncbi:MAG: hypothetical protein ACI9Z3_000405 [Roseivirga sp.]|jgi:hypothetical protein
MTEILAKSGLIIIALYIVSGLLFALPFLIKGIHRLDEGVKKSSVFMMILILPGTVALWPLLLSKWRKTKKS